METQFTAKMVMFLNIQFIFVQILKQFLKNRTGDWVTNLYKLAYRLFFEGTKGLIF